MMSGQPPQSQTAPIDEFRVLWTSQKKQKLKKWQDGFLRFHTYNKRMIVYDEGRALVCDMYLQRASTVQEGDQLEFEQHLVTVEEYTGRVIQDLSAMITPILERREQRHQLQSPHSVARPRTATAQQRVYPDRVSTVIQETPVPSRIHARPLETPMRAAPVFGGLNGADHRPLIAILGGGDKPALSVQKLNPTFRTPSRAVAGDRGSLPIPQPRLQNRVDPRTPSRAPVNASSRGHETTLRPAPRATLAFGDVFEDDIPAVSGESALSVMRKPMPKRSAFNPPSRRSMPQQHDAYAERATISSSPEPLAENEGSHGEPVPQPPTTHTRPTHKAPTYTPFIPPKPTNPPLQGTNDTDARDLHAASEPPEDVLPVENENTTKPKRVRPTFKRPTFVTPVVVPVEVDKPKDVDSDIEMVDPDERSPSPPPSAQVRVSSPHSTPPPPPSPSPPPIPPPQNIRKRASEHVPVTKIRLGTAKRKKLLCRMATVDDPIIVKPRNVPLETEVTDGGGEPSVPIKGTGQNTKGKTKNGLTKKPSVGIKEVDKDDPGIIEDDVVHNAVNDSHQDPQSPVDIRSPSPPIIPLPEPTEPPGKKPKQPRKSRKKAGGEKEDELEIGGDEQPLNTTDVAHKDGSLESGGAIKPPAKGKAKGKQQERGGRGKTADTSRASKTKAALRSQEPPAAAASDSAASAAASKPQTTITGQEQELYGPWSIEAWDLFGYGRPTSVR